MNADGLALRHLARLRWRMAIAISVIMVIIYFGFVLLVAFDKPAMGRLLMPGLSLGIVLGAGVIALTWALTWFYVQWANRHVDHAVRRLGQDTR